MDIVNTGFALVFAIVILWIVWGAVMYFFELTSEEKKKENKPILLGGIGMLILLMLLYALVGWIRGLLGL